MSNIRETSHVIGKALYALEDAIKAVGKIEGVAETAEYKAMVKEAKVLHRGLNEMRKLTGMKHGEFMVWIGLSNEGSDIVLLSGGGDKD